MTRGSKPFRNVARRRRNIRKTGGVSHSLMCTEPVWRSAGSRNSAKFFDAAGFAHPQAWAQSCQIAAARADRGATMKKTAIGQALICALVGPALLVAVRPPFAQVQSAGQERRQVAQFCAPPDQGGSAPRLYCQGGPAWASQQTAQQNVEPRLDPGTSAPRAAAVPMLH